MRKKLLKSIISVLLSLLMLATIFIVPTTAAPKKLSKSDFTFGGRKVNGYTNFIDLCEKKGGKHEYYFDTPSSACKKANRGLNVDDMFCSTDPKMANKIFKKYGTTKEIWCDDTAPAFVLKKNYGGVWANKKYVYKFKKGKRTFYKTFYFYMTSHTSDYFLLAVEYTVS